MKNFPLAIAILLLSSVGAFAQDVSNASYTVDNFDLASGVRITLPPPPPVKQLRKGRGLTATSLNHTSSVAPLARTTTMNWAGTLSGFTTGNPTIDSYILY